MLHNTLIANGINRRRFTGKKAFNRQLGGHIQRWYGAGISAPPTLCTRPKRLLVLFFVVLLRILDLGYQISILCAVYKKPPEIQGLSFFDYSPHLADRSIRRNWHLPLRHCKGGCRASQGRFPPPLLMRAALAGCTYAIVLSTFSYLL
jgi:hypothetical protein